MRAHALFVIVLPVLLVGCPSGGATRTTIGSAGGSVSIGDRIVVTVPSGALASPTELGVEEISSAGLGSLPEGAEAIGPYVALTPHGTTFSSPVTVTIPYSGAGAGITVMRIDSPSDTSWEALAGAELTGTRATFATDHFSIVVVTSYAGGCGTERARCCEAGTLEAADDPEGDGCFGPSSVNACRRGECVRCGASAGASGRCAGRDLVAECAPTGLHDPVECVDQGSDGYLVTCCEGELPDAGLVDGGSCGVGGQACCSPGALGDGDPDRDGCAGDAFGMGCRGGVCLECRVNAGIVGSCAGRDLVAECVPVGGGTPAGCHDTPAGGYEVVCCPSGPPGADAGVDGGSCGGPEQPCCGASALSSEQDPDRDGCTGDAFGMGCSSGTCRTCSSSSGFSGRCAGRDLEAECAPVGGGAVGCTDDADGDGYAVTCCR